MTTIQAFPTKDLTVKIRDDSIKKIDAALKALKDD
jgi:hypothetical protein